MTPSPGSTGYVADHWGCWPAVGPWSRNLPLWLLFFIYSCVQFSCSVVSDSLRSHELQHARLPCPSLTPGVYSNSCPLSPWCHPTISSSAVPFSCLQSFPASGSFQMTQFFASSGQSIGVSASAPVLPMNIQDWFPLGLTGLISLQNALPSFPVNVLCWSSGNSNKSSSGSWECLAHPESYQFNHFASPSK